MQFEDCALKLNASDFASRSKAKVKTTRTQFCQLIHKNLYLLGQELGLILNHKNIRSPIFQCRRKINLLRHGSLPREGRWSDWILENKKTIFRNISCAVIIGLTRNGRKAWQEEEETRKDSSTVLILQEKFFTSQLFKVIQDAISLIPSLHHNVAISGRFLQVHLSRWMCNQFTFHHQFRDWYGGSVKIWANRQTVFFLPVDPMDKNHKDPDTIDLGAPRLAQYMHKAWKKHQNTVYWVDIKLVQKKGLKFYQTRSNAIILHDALPAYCIPKVVRMENWRSCKRKSFYITSTTSPRQPPKMSLKTWLDEGIGFRSCSTRQKAPNHPNGETRCDRKTRPWSSAQEIDTRFSRDCKNVNLDVDADHDRTGETRCDWTTNRFVLNVQRGGHRLQNMWIATFSCETSRKFSCSWAGQEDQRTTFVDKIFKPIYNKIMPTTHLVKSPRRWLRTLAM